MATTGSGFDVPIQLNLERGQAKLADKRAHKNEEWEDQHNDLRESIKNTQQKLWNLDKSSPDYAAQHAQGLKDLTSSIQAYQDFLHPEKNPGMFEKVRHLIGMEGKPHPLAAPQRISSETTPGVAPSTVDLGSGSVSFPASAPVTVTGPTGVKASQQNTVFPNVKGLVEPGNIDIWKRPTVHNADGSHSSEYSTSFQDDKGREVLVPTVVNGKFLTPDGKKPAEGSPEEKAMFKAAWDHYLKTGENLGKFDNPDNADAYAGILHNRGAKPTPQVVKAWAGQIQGQTPAPSTTTTPQDINLPSQSSPVTLAATPSAHTATAGPTPTPDESSSKPLYPSQVKERAKRLQDSQKQAGLMASGAPPSAEDQAVTGANAQNAGALAAIRGGMRSFSELNPNATPEEKQAQLQDLIQKHLGTNVVGNWTNVAGKMNGQPTNLQFDKKTGKYRLQNGESVPPEMLATFIPDAKPSASTEQIGEYNKAVDGGYQGTYPEWLAEQRRIGAPSTSPMNEGREDYAKSHGFKSWTEIPDQYRDVAMNYEIRKQAMDKAYPTSTTTTSYQENYLHQKVPVVATNYRTPQGVETLKDPLWFLASPAPKPGDGVISRNSHSNVTPPASPKDLLTEAKSRNPATSQPKPSAKHTPPASIEATWAAQNPSSKRTGNVRIEQPLFGVKNKEYDDTQTAVDGAKERVSTMEKNLKSALNGDQQAMLSLVANHIGMTLGAQKGARINQAVWNEAVASAPWAQTTYAKSFHDDPQTGEMVFDGWKGGVNLTPEQMKQMVNLAHERESTLEDSLKTIETRLNSGVADPSGGNTQSPDAVKNEANKKQFAKAPDIGTIEEGTSGKHKYLGGDPTKKENWELVKQ